MAKFELNIYGENDEIIKKYETDHIRYGVLMKALEMEEKADKGSNRELIEGANTIVKMIFKGLTDDELMLADVGDVFATYKQVAMQANGVHDDGSESKN